MTATRAQALQTTEPAPSGAKCLTARLVDTDITMTTPMTTSGDAASTARVISLVPRKVAAMRTSDNPRQQPGGANAVAGEPKLGEVLSDPIVRAVIGT